MEYAPWLFVAGTIVGYIFAYRDLRPKYRSTPVTPQQQADHIKRFYINPPGDNK